MAVKKTSFIRRVFRFIGFRFIPLLLITAILWSGYQVAQAVTRQWDERSEIEGRKYAFPGTATAIAALSTINVPTDESTLTAIPATPTSTITDEPTQVPPTSTNTLEPTDLPTETTAPTETSTDEPTKTPIPPTQTDEPTNTSISPTETDIPTATLTETPTEEPTTEPVQETPLSVLQFDATNTPRPLIFATNTPALDSAQPQIATNTEVPTQEILATPAPVTETPIPTVTTESAIATDTPVVPTLPPATPTVATQVEATRPLPTVLFPIEGEAGRILNGTAVPTSVPLLPRDNRSLVNIILLGGDDELTTDGTVRTDTMIIVSIDRDTNTVSMLSFPRDLFVYLPTNNGAMERLNVVYGVGENVGWTDGGFGLLRQTILYNFGINVHYYAKVNFSGFQQIIDTMGGVDIAVDCAYQDYPLIGAEVPEGAQQVNDDGLRTLPVGYYTLDGGQALWYARTRLNSTDFDRGRRQQQLLRSIWRKARTTVNLTNVGTLWDQGMQIIETDMQLEDLISLLPLALSVDVDRIRSFTFVRTYHTTPWQPPDGSFVQLPIYDTMRPLLEDFYRAPVDSQVIVEGATIAVYNGTINEYWDFVAAERLQWEGFRSSAAGTATATDFTDTILIDHTGDEKGSSLSEIAQILNVRSENIRVEPDPNRTAVFEVILGSNYNSCPGGVIAVEETGE